MMYRSLQHSMGWLFSTFQVSIGSTTEHGIFHGITV